MNPTKRFALASVALLGLGVGSNAFATEAAKPGAPAQLASASAGKSVVSTRPRLAREYIIYVLTTESRIPKRYIFRFASDLSTSSPVVMYFNNNRLQLLQADLTGLRMH